MRTSRIKYRKVVLLYLTTITSTWLILTLRIVRLDQTLDKPYNVTFNKGYDVVINKQRDVRVVTDLWTPVKGLKETHVFNAYYTGRDDYVRIVGVAPTRLLTSVQCTFMCLADAVTIEATVNGRIEQMIDHHGLRHNTVEIRCKVPVNCCSAVVSLSAPGNSSIIYLRIHFPSASPQPIHRFSVCYPVIHSNYGAFTEFVQSVELDSLLGGESFTLYYDSATPEVDAVLRMYADTGLLKVVPWNLPKVDVHYHAQVASIRDCFYRNMHTSVHLVFKDFDEVLLPLKHPDWISFLDDNTKRDSKFAAFIFRNSVIYKGDPDVADGMPAYLFESAKAFGLTALLKQHRQVKVWPDKLRSKFIVKSEGVDNVEIHIVKALRKGYKTVVLNETEALLFHYKRFVDRTIPRKRDDSMLRFKYSLINKVNKTYSILNRDYKIPKPVFP